MYMDLQARSRAPAATPFDITVFEDFSSARPVWSSFERDKLCYAFQTQVWLETWHEHIGRRANIRPVLVAILDRWGGRLLFLPMSLESRLGARVLTWLGGRASDYHAPLLGAGWPQGQDTIDVKALWAEVQRRAPAFDAVHFEKQPERIGDHRNPFLDLGLGEDPICASSANLGSSWTEYYQSRRSRQSRRTIAYYRRSLEKKGSLVVTLDVREPAHVDRVMDALATMKDEKIALVGGRPLFNKPGILDFYTAMAKTRSADHSARALLSVLELDDEVIAAHWGVAHNGRLISLLPSYSQAYAAASPGVQLMIAIMEWCCANDTPVFDFSLGDEAYKDKWSDDTMLLYTHVRLRRARGLVYLARERAIQVARRLARRYPALSRVKPGLRQWIAKCRTIRGGATDPHHVPRSS